MSVRTQEELFDTLAADLIWRKKEIATFRGLLSSATPDRREPLLRAGLTLVYAHWEGFIKNSSNWYLEYLHNRSLRYAELAPNFIALGSRSVVRKAGLSNQTSLYIDVVNFFIGGLHERSRLPYKEGISTRANLSAEVLKDIVVSLGLDYTPFEIKSHLIDERLLRMRNTIAHGEYLALDEQTFYEISSDVLAMLDAYRAQIDNAVTLRTYRAAGT